VSECACACVRAYVDGLWALLVVGDCGLGRAAVATGTVAQQQRLGLAIERLRRRVGMMRASTATSPRGGGVEKGSRVGLGRRGVRWSGPVESQAGDARRLRRLKLKTLLFVYIVPKGGLDSERLNLFTACAAQSRPLTGTDPSRFGL